MINEAKIQKTKEIVKPIILTLLILSTIQIATAIGYAPIGVYGEVTLDQLPLQNKQITLQAFIDNEQINEISTSTNNNGEFYAAITAQDGQSPKIVITIHTQEEHMHIIQSAQSWNDYEVQIDITSSVQTSQESQTSTTINKNSAPTSSSFEQDFKAIEEGKAIDDQALRDKYNIQVEEKRDITLVQAVKEAPTSFTKSITANLKDAKIQAAIVILLVLCIAILRHEMKREV